MRAVKRAAQAMRADTSPQRPGRGADHPGRSGVRESGSVQGQGRTAVEAGGVPAMIARLPTYPTTTKST
eukprot:1808547-Rhodomonas_salina.1